MASTNNYKEGTVLECIKSESHAYKKGNIYTVVTVEGVKGLKGDDGLFDPLSLLCSSFRPQTAMQQVISKLKVAK